MLQDVFRKTRGFWSAFACGALLACSANGGTVDGTMDADTDANGGAGTSAANQAGASAGNAGTSADTSHAGATGHDTDEDDDAGALAADGGTVPRVEGDPDFDTSGDSPCTITASSARCDSEPVLTVQTREVYRHAPRGKAPAAGWPAVMLYQGSLYGPAYSWNKELPRDTQFGGYFQVALVALLIDNGFVVVQPAASGGIAWNTNSGGNYDTTSDAMFIPALLEKMAQGDLGEIDMTHLYATGISSGGYMTSRMAVSYAGKFRALAIQSASYATCLGPLCNVPDDMPKDHPPTLILHGAADTTVPIGTARTYYEKLMKAGIEVEMIEDAKAGHQWLDVAPIEITKWFMAH